MPNRPLISIVTPCRNAAAFLPRALNSVASHAIPGEVEHIIMDGGSTDGSRDIIAAYAAANPGLVTHWESTPDRGQSDAINKGFAHARGEFGAWLNADDWYEPGALAAMCKWIRDRNTSGNPRQQNVDVLVGRCRFVDETGKTVFEPMPSSMTFAAFCMLRSRWFAGQSIAQPEAFFRLAAFREVGGLNIDNHYSMDHELWLAIAARVPRDQTCFSACDIPVACMGVHAGQKTRDNRETVRSILVHTSAAIERRTELLGDELPRARAEVAAMKAKLAGADALIARWRCVRQPVLPGPAAGEWDEQFCAALAESRQLQAAEAAARAVHAGAAGEALDIAARRGPAGPLRVLVVVRRDGRAVQHIVRVLPKRAMGISLSAPSRSGLGRAMASIVPLLTPGLHRVYAAMLDAPVAADPHPGERFDMIVTDGVLIASPDAPALLGSLWPWLAPGGVLAQLAEPRATTNLDPYLRWLERRLAEKLSADDDIRLDPKADPSLDLALVGTPEAWRSAHEGALGLDVAGTLGALHNAECVLERRYGGLNFHPLAPFPCIGPAAIAGDDAWSTSVWVKVK